MNRNHRLILTTLAGATLTSPALAQNFGAHLTDGDAIFDYSHTPSGPSNLPTVSQGNSGNVQMNFQIDGGWGAAGTNQLASGNWFYRVLGDNRERHFANADNHWLTGTSRADWTFDKIYTGGASAIQVPDITSHMGFQVYDTGVDSALMATWACFTNNSTSDFHVSLFFAADIDLDISPTGDTYAPLGFPGNDRLWTITDNAANGLFLGVNADAAGVNTIPNILGALTNPFFNDFMGDHNPGGFGPATDNASVMEWQLVVPPGQTVCTPSYIGIGRNHCIPIVPAPGAAALMGVGTLLIARRRR
ncbi:MAG: hypothetical protein IT435_13670 [Phycisphaerales bacterium]|nr:hypothetical protein [Phycisphaerales bacterium]